MNAVIFRLQDKRCSSRIAAFFAWQNHPDYRQWVLI